MVTSTSQKEYLVMAEIIPARMPKMMMMTSATRASLTDHHSPSKMMSHTGRL